MNEHRDNPTQAEEDSLLRRWYVASSLAEPMPSAELLELGERAHRARRKRQSLAVAAVAVVAIVAGIAGVGAWANHRGAAVPAGPSPTTTASTAPTAVETPSPTPKAPSALVLAEHEYILGIHRWVASGWLLTTSRLLGTDGSGWLACWTSTAGVLNRPQPQAMVSGRTVRVFEGETMWTSTDGCATWAQSPVPVLVNGAAFPTATTGYIESIDMSTQNAAPKIYRTDDAGAHWTATAAWAPGVVEAGATLAFTDADHGWLADGHSLWSTADGARSWKKTLLPVPASVRGKLDIVTAPVVEPDGSAVMTAKYDTTPGMDGAKGQRVIYRTVDGGTHWTVSSVLDDPGSLMLSLDDPAAWVALDPSDPASVRTSTDGGATWQTTAVRERWPFTASWFMSGSLSFADALHGWMVIQEPPPPCPQPTNGFAICDYAFSPANHLVATDDGGATWHQVDP
jgi:hypothetical protein